MGSALSSSIVETIGSPVADVMIMKSSAEPALKMLRCTALLGQQQAELRDTTPYCDVSKQPVLKGFPVDN